MGPRQGDTYATRLEDVQDFYEMKTKIMRKMFKTNGIFGKTDIFLDNIGNSFETSGWVIFYKKLTICVKFYLEIKK